MPSLSSSLSNLMIEHGALGALAPLVGGPESDVARAITPAMARVVDGLATLSGAAGAASVAALVDRHDSPLADELAQYLREAPAGPGHEILDRSFGAERGLVVIGLASGLGLAPSLIGRLLPLLAPIVTAELARRWDELGTDEEGLVELLERERRAIERAGLLRGTTFDEAGLVALLRAGEDGLGMATRGNRARTRSGGLRISAATVASGAVDTDEEEREDVAGSVTTIDPVRSGAEGQVEALGQRIDPEAEVPVRLDPPDGIDRMGGEDEIGVEDELLDGPEDGDDRLPLLIRSTDGRGAALTWLGWAVGAVVLVLLLASLLSTCASAPSPIDSTETVVAVDAGVADPLAVAELGPEVASAGQAALITPAGPGRFEGLDPQFPVAPSVPAGSAESEVTAAPEVAEAAAPETVAAPTEGEGSDDPEVGSSLNDLLGLAPVTFEASSADLTADGLAVLDEVARFLAAHDGVIVEIGGHTDSDGDEVANLELSQARADEVLGHLAGAGIDRGRLIAIGHGQTAPKAPNDNPANKAINRRIDFTVR